MDLGKKKKKLARAFLLLSMVAAVLLWHVKAWSLSLAPNASRHCGQIWTSIEGNFGRVAIKIPPNWTVSCNWSERMTMGTSVRIIS